MSIKRQLILRQGLSKIVSPVEGDRPRQPMHLTKAKERIITKLLADTYHSHTYSRKA